MNYCQWKRWIIVNENDDYCQWKRRRERLSKDQFHPSVWCLFTFDWLHLTGWGVQLQLLLTELTGVATDATWWLVLMPLDGTCWLPLAGIDHCCRLLFCLCSLPASPWVGVPVKDHAAKMGPDWLGLHPSEASCCFCPLLCLVYIPVLLSWDGTRKLLQFNFSPLMLQITAFGCWWRRKFTWKIEFLWKLWW